LRDATGTVESIPLISSSIMSKKLAEDLDGLVLDVKVGHGAFMKDLAMARQLAETMVGIGTAYQVKTVALLTAMDSPLGNEVGNANEIVESLEVLRGGGPPDLVEVTMALGIEMLSVAGLEANPDAARDMLEKTRTSGQALELFARVIEAQGGDPKVVEQPEAVLPSAPHKAHVGAPRPGFIATLDAFRLGVAAMRLGAGRERKEDTIDPGVGITVLHKPGDEVSEGEPVLKLTYRHPARLEEALRVLEGAITVGEEPPRGQSLVIDRVG
jgi:pyrimidine-nucleoside phosphorylase